MADTEFTPTMEMAANADRRLKLREKFSRGWTDIGVWRTHRLADRRTVTAAAHIVLLRPDATLAVPDISLSQPSLAVSIESASRLVDRHHTRGDAVARRSAERLRFGRGDRRPIDGRGWRRPLAANPEAASRSGLFRDGSTMISAISVTLPGLIAPLGS